MGRGKDIRKAEKDLAAVDADITQVETTDRGRRNELKGLRKERADLIEELETLRKKGAGSPAHNGRSTEHPTASESAQTTATGSAAGRLRNTAVGNVPGNSRFVLFDDESTNEDR